MNDKNRKKDYRRLALFVMTAAFLGTMIMIFMEEDFSGFLVFIEALMIVFAISWLVPYIISGVEERSFVVSMTFIAVFLRIIFAIFLFVFLQRQGFHDGYLMGNARKFDLLAWDFSQADIGIFRFPGFIYFMGIIYKVFSPDMHRPLLPVFFIALAGGLVVPFTYHLALSLFNERVARISSFIVALHPEFVFLCCAHIREPIMALGFVIALYGAEQIGHGRFVNGMLMGAFGTTLSFFLNPTFGFPTLAGFLVFGIKQLRKRILHIGLIVITLIIIIAVMGQIKGVFLSVDPEDPSSANLSSMLSGESFRAKFADLSKVEMEKEDMLEGSIARRIFVDSPDVIRIPIQILWGILLPLIPQGAYGWDNFTIRILFFFRSIGWQLTFPFLLYEIMIALRNKKFFLLSLFTLGLLIVPAFASGADIWDNPRYRTFGASLLSIAIAIGWVRGIETKSKLLRWFIAMTFILNLLLLGLYSFRYGAIYSPIQAFFSLSPRNLLVGLLELILEDGMAFIALMLYAICILNLLRRGFVIRITR